MLPYLFHSKFVAFLLFALIIIAGCDLLRQDDEDQEEELENDSVWEVHELGIADSPMSIFFHDHDTGWLTFSEQILQSNDGGENWQVTFSNEDDVMFNDSHFYDNTIGWAVDEFGKIYHTSDGGESWSKQFDNHSFTSVYFTDAQNGWAAGIARDSQTGDFRALIMNTSDGGENWYEQESGVGTRLHDVHFVDNQTGWVSGEYIIDFENAYNIVLHTTDGGETWEEQHRMPLYGEVSNIFFIDDKTGWVGVHGDKFLTTDDGGASWQEHEIGYSISPLDMYFLDSELGWIVSGGVGGENGILHTANGGATWEKQFDCEVLGESVGVVTGIYFLDSQSGWATGACGLSTTFVLTYSPN